MQKINFQNLPNTTTPVNASNLNDLQDNVEDAIDDIITEGSWTPTLNNTDNVTPTVSYTTQYGVYKKIGNIVFYEFYIQGKITSLNSSTGYAQINGLPYVAQYSTNYVGKDAGNVGTVYDAVSNTNNIAFVMYSNVIRVQYDYGASANTWKITSGSRFILAGSGFYFTE